MDGSLNNQDRHQAIQKFNDSLPKALPAPGFFNKILGEAASLGIIAKIAPEVFINLYRKFGKDAWIIQNFSDEQIQPNYYIYAGKTWFGPEKEKTFQTLKWQVFDYLQKMRAGVDRKQEQVKNREARLKELNVVYDDLLGKLQAGLVSDENLLNILDALEKKGVITKVGEEDKEKPDVFYFRTRRNNPDHSSEWVHLYYAYKGPNDSHCMERQIYNDLYRFKRTLLDKIHQKSEQIRQERIQRQGQSNQSQPVQGGSRVVETGGSRKCFKAQHAEMNAKGEFGEKNAKQRKEEKKRRKWQKNRDKTKAFQDKYLEDLGSKDGEE